MARKARWEQLSLQDGVMEVRLSSWKYLFDFVTQKMLDYNHYVWRGVRCDDRQLVASFDRSRIGQTRKDIERQQRIHLDIFKRSACGRRGQSPNRLESDNDWWALGQHYGLKTPLLDWTRSPFVAMFFAFEKTGPKQTANRALYAINPATCDSTSKNICDGASGEKESVTFFTPFQDENPRLINQNGLFSRCTAGITIEDWVRKHYQGMRGAILIKFLVPNKNRDTCLKTLNKMNINHLTLFPDLYGASNFANMSSAIDKY